MSVWKELGRFLERGTPLLEEGLKSLQATNALLAALRPAADAAPELIRETHKLVVDTRGLLARSRSSRQRPRSPAEDH